MTNFIPTDLYVVQLYDHGGNPIRTIRSWERVEFSQRINDPWNHVIYLRRSGTDEDTAFYRDLPWDTFIDITRYDYYTGERTLVYSGIHQTTTVQQQINGNMFITMYGAGYTKFLDRRLVIPHAGEVERYRYGFAETVAKGFVFDSMVIPQDPYRRFPGMHLAQDLSRGNYAEYASKYINLESVIKNVCEQGGLDFGIYQYDNQIGQFEFDCRPLWGQDRRPGNTANNTPVVFSVKNNNMLVPLWSVNHKATKNYLYIGGDGTDENRRIVTLSDSVSIAQSPWARCEAYVTDSDADTEYKLYTLGARELDERSTARKFDFDIRQTPSLRWPVHWGLGDVVRAEFAGTLFDKKIVEITVNVSPNTDNIETLTLQMEDYNDSTTGS